MPKMQEDTPDIVVAIDFGMTYTGVAWTTSRTEIQIISNWPGQVESYKTKVPTKLVYDENGNVIRWGFQCNEDDDRYEVFENFKIFLDDENIQAARRLGVRNIPADIEETKRLITDYLQQIYLHIKHSIEANIGSWHEMKVAFIFSVPCAWPLSVLHGFREAFRGAGFGEENSTKHSARLGLTDVEAVAVCAISNSQLKFEDGDVVLVCKAGGGTTEMGLVEVIDSRSALPFLKQVAAVVGVGIGSVMIDRAFQSLVEAKLKQCPNAPAIFHKELAMKLARSSSFQAIKHVFGVLAEELPEYKISLTQLGLGVERDYDYPGLQIRSGRMIFSKAEIKSLFDPQIRSIIRRMDQELEAFRMRNNTQTVKWLVFGGGFAQSAYFLQELGRKYSSRGISIFQAQQPELSVLQGLLLDRKQKLASGTATLKSRIARVSYGILCKQRYDPYIHIGADIEFDSLRKERWAMNQIDWMIKKGDTIDADFSKEVSRKIDPGSPTRSWDVTIIISHNDSNSLPRMLKQAGALKLCTLQVDLTGVSERNFQEKNKRFWQGKRYYLVQFAVRVIVEPADLRFEVWFQGQKYGQSQDSILVQWDPVGASARPASFSNESWISDTTTLVGEDGMDPSRKFQSPRTLGIGIDLRPQPYTGPPVPEQLGTSFDDGLVVGPRDLQASISVGDLKATQSLLEYNFDLVAKDDFAWLQELKDLNYPKGEIAELLVNSQVDSPWIYFDPKASTDHSIKLKYHQPACVHRSPGQGISPAAIEHSPTKSTSSDEARLSWSTDQDSLLFIIEELCGLAGVSPNTRDREKWTGQVLFNDEDAGTTACVTYRSELLTGNTIHSTEFDQEIGRKSGHDTNDWSARTLENIIIALERFNAAVGRSQGNGLCCDSFTILIKADDSSGHEIIELSKVRLTLAVNLLNELKQFQSTPSGIPRKIFYEIIPRTAGSICEVFLGRLPVEIYSSDAMLDLCSLTVQLLTLGFAFYARAHVNAFHPFFLDTPVNSIYLFGAQDPQVEPPRAAATLHRFSCMDSMIQNPVMVFSKVSDSGVCSTEPSYDLLATSIDLVDTWGPGQLIQQDQISITGILIGGGIIQLKDPSREILHWSREISSIRAAAKGVPWSAKAKMRIAGGVEVNRNCRSDLKQQWPMFSETLENLGTYSHYWAFTEFQAGLAITGQQFAGGQLQFNKTWTWHDGNSWKQQFLGLLAHEMPFEELERPWGLQVSFCTGVARRVPLRILLADVMPIFVQTLSLPPEWTILKNEGIIEAFEGGQLKNWLDSLNLLPNSQHLIPLVKRIIHYILLILRDTGIDRTGKKFRIACPEDLMSGKPLSMCLEIPCEKGNLWARILADTKDCATFACMTSICLESDEHRCSKTDPWHCPSLQTAVCRYRAKNDPVVARSSSWRLRDQALYWIGKPESGLQTRVKMSPNNTDAKLYVSISAMSEKTLSRLGTMRLLSKMGHYETAVKDGPENGPHQGKTIPTLGSRRSLGPSGFQDLSTLSEAASGQNTVYPTNMPGGIVLSASLVSRDTK